MKKWYQQHFRRNLIDMHIEDWDETLLSRFDPKDYFENLVEGNIAAPMIYFQSHVGLCYWPTKSGKMHSAFRGREDAMRQLVDMCYAAGKPVIAYYSLIYNNWAYETHPDWQMRDNHGHGSRFDGNRYGLCCPNNADYRAFVAEQIAEQSDYFRFDGIFLDMTFWPMVCYCDSCRARWEAEVGGALPEVVDWNDERWLTFQNKRIAWLGEFAEFATAEVKRHKPDCSVEHQYSTAVNHFWRFGVTENISAASDYAGGDLYGGIAEQSFACKAYYNLTRNQPFEYMTSRCYPALAEHTTNKSMDLLQLSVMLTLFHHGACLLIDAIDPVGTIDRRVYQSIGKVFRAAEAYEPYLSTGEQVFDVALYFSMFGKMDSHQNGIPVDQVEDTTQPHEQALLEASNSLRAHHIPYTVLNSWRLDRLKEAKVLALCDIPFLSHGEIAAIKEYIQGGGRVYISGRTCPQLVEELFGVTFAGYTEHTVTYISPTAAGETVLRPFTREYPLVMFEPQAIYTGKPNGDLYGTMTLPYTVPNPASHFTAMAPGAAETQTDLTAPMYRFSSIHSNPPGIFTDHPAMMMADRGKGKVFYSALPIERAARQQHSDIFSGIMSMLIGETPAFASADAPETVECILFGDRAEGRYLLGLINIQEGFRTIPAPGFTVSVRVEKSPREVVLLPARKPLAFRWEDGCAHIHLEGLHIYDMLEIRI